VRWALNKLGSLGFSNVRSQDALVPRWVRGHAEVTLRPVPQPLVAVALGGSVGTSEDGIEAQFSKSPRWMRSTRRPRDGRRQIVFINQRMERTRDGAGYARP
jgi:hypothetical protein